MSKNKKIYIYTVIILSMVFWGMSFIWSTIVFRYLEPITTVFFRLILSSSILFGGLKLFNKLEKVKKKHYKLFFLSALFNPFLYFIGENFGLKYSSATISAVIIATIPVFSPIAAFFFLKERLSLLNVAGLFLSFVGVLAMLVNKDLSLNAAPIGMICLSFAVIAAIVYSLLLKRLAFHYSAFTVIAVQNLIGAILFLPLFLIFDFTKLSGIVYSYSWISALLMLSVFASSLAFVFFAIGTREIGVSKTSIFTNLIPVITATGSFFLLNEAFSLQKIIGIVIVIGGLFISQLNNKKIPANAEEVFEG
ncbi:MAG: DMT family transporter [Bacteroidetes bacterium]|nr:DMT family transporter [Bacteroidota bacterium]